MNKLKPYYSPRLADSWQVFKQSVPDFIAEWLAYAARLASQTLTPKTAVELNDLQPFLTEVGALGTSAEFASVGSTERSRFGAIADDLLPKVVAAVKNFHHQELIKLC